MGNKTERKVYIKDQHPSREEIAWWRVAGALTPCRGVEGVRNRVKCFVLSTAINIGTSYSLLAAVSFSVLLYTFFVGSYILLLTSLSCCLISHSVWRNHLPHHCSLYHAI
jgi:hypothetical protein